VELVVVNLPNLITLFRLLLVPLTIWLIVEGRYLSAFCCFLVAGLSDAVDGFIARRFNQRTRIGALLDPLADKALLVSVYVTLGIAAQLPDWLVILVVFRDIMIVGGFLFVTILGYQAIWKPLAISKLNTVLQIVLAGLTLARLGLAFDDRGSGMVLVFVVMATTILSGTAYLVRWGLVLAGTENEG
jgi:cardiolipin synthase (CMP-forming)